MTAPVTEIRMPTYNRPASLERALRSLQAQTDPNWRCRVFDDSSDDAGWQVCRALGDPRITHVFNNPRRFAVGNIDQCFARGADADYFFVLEDDNLVLPGFIAQNIQVIARSGAPIVLRNQVAAPPDVDLDALSGLSAILDGRFFEGLYTPQEIRTAALFSLSLSNGGLFWSRSARTDFEVRAPACDAVLQEHLRAALVRDPVYVALEPLAVWTDNAGGSERHSGGDRGFWRRELRLKKAQIAMRRMIAGELRRAGRYDLIASDRFKDSPGQRQRELTKSLLAWPGEAALSLAQRANLTARGAAALLLGALPPDFPELMRTRLRLEPADAA